MTFIIDLIVRFLYEIWPVAAMIGIFVFFWWVLSPSWSDIMKLRNFDD